jgi:cell division protein FtsA
VDLAEEVFHAPVRIGTPKYVGGLSEVVKNPIFATGVGLIQFGYSNRKGKRRDGEEKSGVRSLWSRMRGWFQGSF